MHDRSVFHRMRPSLRRSTRDERAVEALVALINAQLAQVRERELVRAAEAVESVR